MVRQVVNSNPNSPAISGAAIAGIVSGALVASFVAACEAFTRPAIAKRFSQAVDYPQAVHPTFQYRNRSMNHIRNGRLHTV
jgi:hypothetical protein